MLREKGLTRRDVEITRDKSVDFGTGQTPKGLFCSLGYEPNVNKSFLGGKHRWQAVLNDGDYVYLEGDGTIEGMRVTGWN